MNEPFLKFLFIFLFLESISALNGVWRWECQEGYCQKTAITPETEETALSLAACRLLCSDVAALWPKPTGDTKIGTTLVKINPYTIDFTGVSYEKPSHNILEHGIQRFKNQFDIPSLAASPAANAGKHLVLNFVFENPDLVKLELDTKEGYTLEVSETSDDNITATITGDNVFGGLHGIVTLNQLTVYDDLRDEIVIPNEISITDEPAYQWRGILLDTSRNYISVERIQRTLDAMAASKLNSFHWHITDSHSFPFTSESLPDLTKYGAYSPSKVYTPEDVDNVVQYGLYNGVRVIPEFDAPAHVGEGWQNTDFVVCFDAKPWGDYCSEPPCGQFDPTKEELYDALESLYGDMLKQFQPPVFHMGGDEVHFSCWKSVPGIVEWMENKGWGTSDDDFVKLWHTFQNESVTRLYKRAERQIPVILWTSTLTNSEYLEYLPKDQYIIQVWTSGNDPTISNLLNNGYRVIISNYDALYLDCGFGAWIGEGNNWCSPYIGWQKIYDNKPVKLAGDKTGLVLGGEAALWTEQADGTAIDSRLWPRAAAMAEVLWSEPTTDWRQAESRFLVHRERLVDLGVNCDGIEPEWCRQHEESCPINGKWNK